jgi:hypothetical protein
LGVYCYCGEENLEYTKIIFTSTKKINTMKTKYIIITMMIMVCGNIACKKKSSEPFGENVIRYTSDGKNYEIKGKYNSITGDGVNFTDNGNPYNSYLIAGGTGDNVINISIKKGFVLNTSLQSDKSNYYFSISNYKQQSQSTPHSIQFIIENDNATFIYGSFSGKTFISDLSNKVLDSFIITDGYFDIAK